MLFYRRQRGFTLIELLIVVAVVGILAAVAIPRFMGARDRAAVAQAQAVLDAIKTGLGMYATDQQDGTYPSAIADYSALTTTLANYVDLPTTAPFTFGTYSSTGGSYTLTVTANDSANTPLTLTPAGVQ